MIAVRYGTLTTRRSEVFYRYESYGEADGKATLDFYFWVLRRGSETILVDTGFDPIVASRRERICLRSPLEVLREDLGVEAKSVSTLIVTHFHYDHIGNLGAFPNARIIVPRKEMTFWIDRGTSAFQFSSHVEQHELARLAQIRSEGRLRTTEGTEEIVEGITAITVGGHSPGQQLTLVSTADAPVLLTSDAVHLYEELEQARPFAVVADLAAMYEAYDRCHDLAASCNAIIVPGHDPLTFERFDRIGPGVPAVRLA